MYGVVRTTAILMGGSLIPEKDTFREREKREQEDDDFDGRIIDAYDNFCMMAYGVCCMVYGVWRMV